MRRKASEACRARGTNADGSAHRTSARPCSQVLSTRCKQRPNVAVCACDPSTWATEEAGLPKAGDEPRLRDGQNPHRNTQGPASPSHTWLVSRSCPDRRDYSKLLMSAGLRYWNHLLALLQPHPFPQLRPGQRESVSLCPTCAHHQGPCVKA